MKNTNANAFRLSFTPAELFWLMSSFGNLPPAFLGQPFAGQTNSQVRQALEQGKQSLETRDLIRIVPGKATCQVESALAALLHWLCSPARTIQMHYFQPQADSPVVTAICLDAEPVLLVEVAAQEYPLSLFQGIEPFLPVIMKTLKLPGYFGKSKPRHPGQEPEPVNWPEPQYTIQLAWKNPVAAHAALERMGFPAQQVAHNLEWAAQLTHLVLFSEEDVTQCIFAFGKQAAFIGKPGNSRQLPVTFSQHEENQIHNDLLELFSCRPVTV